MPDTFWINEIIIPKIAAFFSMVGSSIIIGEVIQDWKEKRNKLGAVARILLAMSIGDFLFSFAWFMASWMISGEEDPDMRHQEPTSGGCKFQAFLMQIGLLSSVLFNGSLAFIYMLMLRYYWTGRSLIALFRKMAIVIWTLCLVVAIIPWALNMYHDAGPTCYIASDDDDVDVAHVAFMLQILPIWLVIFLDCVVMYKIYRKTRALEVEAQAAQANAFFGGENDLNNDLDSTTSNPDDLEQQQAPQPSIDKLSFELPLESVHEDTPSNVENLNNKMDVEEEIRQSEKTTTSGVVTSSMSRRAGTQAMWYIGGYFLSFGPTTISVLVYLFRGDYSTPLYRMGYFFLAAQGVWNCIIYTRGRREMKTWVGKRLKTILFGLSLRCQCHCSCVPKDHNPNVSNSYYSKDASQRYANSRNSRHSRRGPAFGTGFSAVSNASTVVHANRDVLSRKSKGTAPMSSLAEMSEESSRREIAPGNFAFSLKTRSEFSPSSSSQSNKLPRRPHSQPPEDTDVPEQYPSDEPPHKPEEPSASDPTSKADDQIPLEIGVTDQPDSEEIPLGIEIGVEDAAALQRVPSQGELSANSDGSSIISWSR